MKKLLIISILFISLFSCRTVKKEWIEENYVSRENFDASKVSTITSIETLERKVYTDFVSEINNYLENNSESSSTSENENTTVSGTIEAEEGKEKSVIVGDTKIISNGANVTFETSSTKAITKQFEKVIEEQNEKFEFQKSIYESTVKKLDSLASELNNIKKEIEQLKTTKQKEVVKKGFNFWVIIIIIVVIVGFLAYKIYGSSITKFIKGF